MLAGEKSAKIDFDYAIIFNATSNGMAFTEYDSGKIVDVNTAWIQATGIAREDSIGRTAFELGVWANMTERDACLAQLVNNGRVMDFEARLVMNSAERPHFISEQYTEMGGEPFVLWEFRDITQRKQAEAELIATKNKLQAMLDALPDLLFEVSAEGRIHTYHSPSSSSTGASSHCLMRCSTFPSTIRRLTLFINSACGMLSK